MDTSRRDLFRILGSSMVLTAAGAGVVAPAVAQHVHAVMADAKSLAGGPAFRPKCFTPHQFATLHKLCDLVIPADEHSPGAADAGAAEFIDFLSAHNEELAAIFTGGMSWLDDYMGKTYGADFLSARSAQQTEVLDSLAWREKHRPETAGGRRFWTWLRNMTVDAYYTSPAGVADLGFMGNGAMSHFSVPREAVEYAMKRSPFANEG